MLSVVLATMLCCAAEPVPLPADASVARVSQAIARPPTALHQAIARAKLETPLARQNATIKKQRDSIWNGLLIGAGAAGGYIWGRSLCGPNDRECPTISTTAGVLGGAGIGAAIGAILDAFSG
jgi:hypothetical protein